MLAANPSPAPSKKTAAARGDNPLLTESTLPYHMPPFDKIKNEHFAPAYTAALAEHLKEVDAIANKRTRRLSKIRSSRWNARVAP